MPGKNARNDFTEVKRKKMLSTIKDLNSRMKELNKLKKQLKAEERKRKTTFKKAELLEEIKVPALELLKEKSRVKQNST